MYAIISTGGKQYKVQKGDLLDVELLNEEQSVTFDHVVFFHDGKTARLGTPAIEGISVKAEVLGMTKGPKVVAYKYKRRKNYRRKVGHRQKYTRVKITEIVA